MRLILLLAVCLANASKEGDSLLSQSATVCSTQCLKKRPSVTFTAGKTYQYKFDTKTQTQFVESNQNLVLSIQGTMSLSALSDCEMAVKISKVAVKKSVLGANDQMIDTDPERTELLEAQAKFGYDGGRVTSFCPSTRTSVFVRNFLASLISTFQVATEEEALVQERDIVGTSTTQYSFDKSRSTYTKRRLNVKPNSLTRAQQRCTVTRNQNSGTIDKVNCFESLELPIESSGEQGKPFVNEIDIDKTSESETDKNAIFDFLIKRENLTFVPLPMGEEKSDDVSSVLGLLGEMKTDENSASVSSRMLKFNRLVYSLKQVKDFAPVWESLKTMPQSVQDRFRAALSQVKTESAVLTLLERGFADQALVSLANIPRVTKKIINAAATSLVRDANSVSMSLAVASLVNQFCQQQSVKICQTDQQVLEIVATLTKRVPANCLVSSSDMTVLATIESLGNLGLALRESEVNLLTSCFTQKDQPVSLAVSAIEALRFVSCDKMNFMAHLLNGSLPNELRISLVPSTMRCLTRDQFKSLLHRVRTQRNSQLIVYIASLFYAVTRGDETQYPRLYQFLQEPEFWLEIQAMHLPDFTGVHGLLTRNSAHSIFRKKIKLNDMRLTTDHVFGRYSNLPTLGRVRLGLDQTTNLIEIGFVAGAKNLGWLEKLLLISRPLPGSDKVPDQYAKYDEEFANNHKDELDTGVAFVFRQTGYTSMLVQDPNNVGALKSLLQQLTKQPLPMDVRHEVISTLTGQHLNYRSSLNLFSDWEKGLSLGMSLQTDLELTTRHSNALSVVQHTTGLNLPVEWTLNEDWTRFVLKPSPNEVTILERNAVHAYQAMGSKLTAARMIGSPNRITLSKFDGLDLQRAWIFDPKLSVPLRKFLLSAASIEPAKTHFKLLYEIPTKLDDPNPHLKLIAQLKDSHVYRLEGNVDYATSKATGEVEIPGWHVKVDGNVRFDPKLSKHNGELAWSSLSSKDFGNLTFESVLLEQFQLNLNRTSDSASPRNFKLDLRQLLATNQKRYPIANRLQAAVTYTWDRYKSNQDLNLEYGYGNGARVSGFVKTNSDIDSVKSFYQSDLVYEHGPIFNNQVDLIPGRGLRILFNSNDNDLKRYSTDLVIFSSLTEPGNKRGLEVQASFQNSRNSMSNLNFGLSLFLLEQSLQSKFRFHLPRLSDSNITIDCSGKWQQSSPFLRASSSSLSCPFKDHSTSKGAKFLASLQTVDGQIDLFMNITNDDKPQLPWLEITLNGNRNNGKYRLNYKDKQPPADSSVEIQFTGNSTGYEGSFTIQFQGKEFSRGNLELITKTKEQRLMVELVHVEDPRNKLQITYLNNPADMTVMEFDGQLATLREISYKQKIIYKHDWGRDLHYEFSSEYQMDKRNWTRHLKIVPYRVEWAATDQGIYDIALRVGCDRADFGKSQASCIFQVNGFDKIRLKFQQDVRWKLSESVKVNLASEMNLHDKWLFQNKLDATILMGQRQGFELHCQNLDSEVTLKFVHDKPLSQISGEFLLDPSFLEFHAGKLLVTIEPNDKVIFSVTLSKQEQRGSTAIDGELEINNFDQTLKGHAWIDRDSPSQSEMRLLMGPDKTSKNVRYKLETNLVWQRNPLLNASLVVSTSLAKGEQVSCQITSGISKAEFKLDSMWDDGEFLIKSIGQLDRSKLVVSYKLEERADVGKLEWNMIEDTLDPIEKTGLISHGWEFGNMAKFWLKCKFSEKKYLDFRLETDSTGQNERKLLDLNLEINHFLDDPRLKFQAYKQDSLSYWFEGSASLRDDTFSLEKIIIGPKKSVIDVVITQDKEETYRVSWISDYELVSTDSNLEFNSSLRFQNQSVGSSNITYRLDGNMSFVNEYNYLDGRRLLLWTMGSLMPWRRMHASNWGFHMAVEAPLLIAKRHDLITRYSYKKDTVDLQITYNPMIDLQLKSQLSREDKSLTSRLLFNFDAFGQRLANPVEANFVIKNLKPSVSVNTAYTATGSVEIIRPYAYNFDLLYHQDTEFKLSAETKAADALYKSLLVHATEQGIIFKLGQEHELSMQMQSKTNRSEILKASGKLIVKLNNIDKLKIDQVLVEYDHNRKMVRFVANASCELFTLTADLFAEVSSKLRMKLLWLDVSSAIGHELAVLVIRKLDDFQVQLLSMEHDNFAFQAQLELREHDNFLNFLNRDAKELVNITAGSLGRYQRQFHLFHHGNDKLNFLLQKDDNRLSLDYWYKNDSVKAQVQGNLLGDHSIESNFVKLVRNPSRPMAYQFKYNKDQLSATLNMPAASQLYTASLIHKPSELLVTSSLTLTSYDKIQSSLNYQCKRCFAREDTANLLLNWDLTRMLGRPQQQQGSFEISAKCTRLSPYMHKLAWQVKNWSEHMQLVMANWDHELNVTARIEPRLTLAVDLKELVSQFNKREKVFISLDGDSESSGVLYRSQGKQSHLKFLTGRLLGLEVGLDKGPSSTFRVTCEQDRLNFTLGERAIHLGKRTPGKGYAFTYGMEVIRGSSQTPEFQARFSVAESQTFAIVLESNMFQGENKIYITQNAAKKGFDLFMGERLYDQQNPPIKLGGYYFAGLSSLLVTLHDTEFGYRAEFPQPKIMKVTFYPWKADWVVNWNHDDTFNVTSSGSEISLKRSQNGYLGQSKFLVNLESRKTFYLEMDWQRDLDEWVASMRTADGQLRLKQQKFSPTSYESSLTWNDQILAVVHGTLKVGMVTQNQGVRNFLTIYSKRERGAFTTLQLFKSMREQLLYRLAESDQGPLRDLDEALIKTVKTIGQRVNTGQLITSIQSLLGDLDQAYKQLASMWHEDRFYANSILRHFNRGHPVKPFWSSPSLADSFNPKREGDFATSFNLKRTTKFVVSQSFDALDSLLKELFDKTVFLDTNILSAKLQELKKLMHQLSSTRVMSEIYSFFDNFKTLDEIMKKFDLMQTLKDILPQGPASENLIRKLTEINLKEYMSSIREILAWFIDPTLVTEPIASLKRRYKEIVENSAAACHLQDCTASLVVPTELVPQMVTVMDRLDQMPGVQLNAPSWRNTASMFKDTTEFIWTARAEDTLNVFSIDRDTQQLKTTDTLLLRDFRTKMLGVSLHGTRWNHSLIVQMDTCPRVTLENFRTIKVGCTQITMPFHQQYGTCAVTAFRNLLTGEITLTVGTKNTELRIPLEIQIFRDVSVNRYQILSDLGWHGHLDGSLGSNNNFLADDRIMNYPVQAPPCYPVY